jgi:hypothetical protein
MRNFVLAAGATLLLSVGGFAQEAEAPLAPGGALGTTNEQGAATPMSDNVKVFGSFHFTESCTFDPDRNLILSMNVGSFAGEEADGYVSLINPDGSVHTAKWIGTGLGGVTLTNPIGSAIRNGKLYTVDGTSVLSFDLKTGAPLGTFAVEGATFLNGIAVAEDGTVYTSNSREPEKVYKVTPSGESSVFAEGAPLAAPNGVAMDHEGNVVVVNIGNNAVLTYSPDGKLLRTEHAVEGGNDGVVVTEDGTKYVSSVRFGSVSRIVPGKPAEVIASGIPSAASMCYDSIQKQLVIPMNPNNALAFISLK